MGHRAARSIGVLALVLAACTSTSTSTSEAPTTTTTSPPSSTSSTAPTSTTVATPQEPRREVTIGVELPVESLNPFATVTFRDRVPGNLVWAIVYDNDPDTWEKVPDVVVDLPSRSGGITVNDDGTMTVRYEIVDGATWSDGVPIGGDDVAFTAEAMRDMAERGVGSVDPVMSTLVEATAEGPTASLTFSEPSLVVEDALWIVLPSHALEGVDRVETADATEWPSGGPFVVDTFDPVDGVRFVRNDAYWKTDADGTRLPYLDAVTIAPASRLADGEPTSPVADFVLGRFDVVPVSPSAEDLRRVEGAIEQGAELQHVRTPVIEQLTFNFADSRFAVNPESVNEIVEFRRAVASAIDPERILAEAAVPWLPETPGMLVPVGESAWSVYQNQFTVRPDLPEGAASVVTTTGNADERPRIVQALRPAFAAAGVAYEARLEDSQVFFQQTIVDGSYDIGLWAWIADGSYRGTLQLMEFLDPAASPPEGNFGNWGSGGTANDATRRFSQIVAETATTVDADRFDELVREAEGILATEVPIIPLFSRGSGLAVWPGSVTGVVHNGTRSDFTWNIERWRPAE